MSKKNWQQVKDDFEKEEAEHMMHEEVVESAEDSQPEFASREALEEALMQAQREAKDNLEKAVRAVADTDNVRKRAEREVIQARIYGQEKLIQSLIPVVDSLEQALANTDESVHSEIREGVVLTLKLLLAALAKHEVIQLNPEGQVFNPQEHEAMSILVSDAHAPNTIMTVFQKGYKLNDRVIRPARVIVSKAVS